jgi:anti-sigma B factor antagonist
LPLESQIRNEGTVAFVALRGKVVLGEASDSLRKLVENLATDGRQRIVLNLSGVPFIDSAGLGALALSYTKVKAAGGLLKIAEASPRVQDALEMTRLTRLFPVYTSEQDAAASFADVA